MTKPAKEMRVRVAAARHGDVGLGIARLDGSVLERLGLNEGDAVHLVGERETVAVARPAHRADEGLDIVRIDGLQRTDLLASIGQPVSVRKAEVVPAVRVALVPLRRGAEGRASEAVLRRLLSGRPVLKGSVVTVGGEAARARAGHSDDLAYPLREARFLVAATEPDAVVRITESTGVVLKEPRDRDREDVEDPVHRRPRVTYDDVGGFRNAVDRVRELVEIPLRHPELFRTLDVTPPQGVLLHGPPGTGKTLLARAVANEAAASFFHIAGPEIMGRYYGEAEERLRNAFAEAESAAPSVLFIDEIDSIASKRSDTRGEVERRVVAQLLTLMDGLEPVEGVVVLAATNRVDAIDEALRRPGRFDREIRLDAPDAVGRREILAIHTRGTPLAPDVDLDRLAAITHGFVGADLAALVREAAFETLRRTLPDRHGDPARAQGQLCVTNADFQHALKHVHPSALREMTVDVADVAWDDVGGLAEVKRRLREGVELPFKDPEAFRRLGIRPPRGFLLFGPPGTGKTLLARAVAREAEVNFVVVRASALLTPWFGESEQAVSRLFARARQVAPAVLFLDEIDALAPRRGSSPGEPVVTERVVDTLLAEMDGVEPLEGVVVLGATNRPGLLDPAMIRPGRLEELLYVPPPDADVRREILEIHTRDVPLAPDVDLDALAARAEGYTGADLSQMVRRAALTALRDDPDAKTVTAAHFEEALRETRATTSPELTGEYEEFAESFGRHGPHGPSIGFRM